MAAPATTSGDDTITGGPGRDVIAGDTAGSGCHWIQCRMPYGNDSIDARDGEADSISCGVGTDTVRADPIDTVADDCETVDRNGAAGGGTVPATTGPAGAAPGTEPAGGRRAVALTALRATRRGRVIVVRGRATGIARVTVGAGAVRRTLAVR